MNAAQLSFLLIVFGIVCALAWLAMMLFAPGVLRTRLRRFIGKSDTTQLESDGWVERVAKVTQPLTKLSIPEEGWEKSQLRTRFMNAGWRNPVAPTLFFAAKTSLALLGPALVGVLVATAVITLSGLQLLFLLLLTAAVGYYMPNVSLSRIARRRQREIFETLPDALDLLTVCVEAGLSLERAFVKVAGEIHIKSVTLAQELQLVLMEMRAGFSKERALRNFALRSGVGDVDTLVAMLIQSERFGTSVGDSLRVYSDNLRNKRRLLAEECAAKIGLKLLFPLIFCIFPTLLMVLLGPAGIQLSRTLSAVNGAP
ncbi:MULTISPECIES: type II secretion system F family protein [unclassified Massilia]|uniref:type II secretion system F family protein n=1 Tax=unclassified Massilia TaxID=2609279 RepID=UPI00177B572F|nr:MULTISPECIES: type II secretion system F family protein [unclassified Massilia]MBD8533242.1 type II secretion system F family protein [Massilia sp. CFBP 13647]MBD8674451.1 type II secretion system F family protein [Massilia sp. CFBP 13721]